MVEITNDIITALQNDTALTALVNKRIYWVKPPGESYNYPFLTVIESSNSVIDYEDDEESTEQVDISIDIYSKGTNLKPLKDAVARVMKENGFERQPSGPDEYIMELKVYHKTLNFSKEVSV